MTSDEDLRRALGLPTSERDRAAADLERCRERLSAASRALADVPESSWRRRTRDARVAAEREVIGAEAEFKRAASRYALATDSLAEHPSVPRTRPGNASEFLNLGGRPRRLGVDDPD